ncbi:MAG: helix-turn-helix transcriptional regulator [Proteobacteria bacterium]|nr:helix-turn-helix transcriptional regulator [Pseudomonadota bacterium]
MAHSLEPLASAIRRRREELGWSQEALAHRCKFDRTYISMLERGKRNPSFLNLLKLADGLGLSVSSLTEMYRHDANAD